jgi:Polysaccharide lyase
MDRHVGRETDEIAEVAPHWRFFKMVRSARSLLRAPSLLVGLAVLGSAALLPRPAAARNMMSADGPGGTYALLMRSYTIEVPDCGHKVEHITEEMDQELKKNVFVFHAHVNQDDDRCGAQDRQRTEIRGKGADIVANAGATVYYRWKFRLPQGFQTSSSFTHIFQIKSDQAAPIMTLTPRGNTMSIDGRVGVRGTTELAKFINVWVVVDLKIVYGAGGSIAMTIRRLSDGQMLFNHSGSADTDDGAGGQDPKFGIYRSLNNRGSLRDEQVKFADFCVSKTSAADCDDGAAPPPPANDAGSPPESDASAGMPDAGSATPDAQTPSPSGSGGASQPPATGGSGGGSGAGGSSGSSGSSTGGKPGGGSGGSGGSGTRPPGNPDPGSSPAGGGGGSSWGCSIDPNAAPAGTALSCLALAGLALLRRTRRRR